jgi:hypothetical protein
MVTGCLSGKTFGLGRDRDMAVLADPVAIDVPAHRRGDPFHE